MNAAASTALPPLREDLSLHPGPIGANGWPSWVLRDPVRNCFFRIDWPGFEVLARWHLGDADRIAQAIGAETMLEVSAAEIGDIVEALRAGFLLQSTDPADTARLAAMAVRPSWATWLLHHYLFFRVPLLRPDRFLAATAPWVAWAGSRIFLWISLAVLVVGVSLLLRQWGHFVTTVQTMLTPAGAVTFAVALALAKTVHEAAHAYTARAKGCRVPTMGVTFLVLWPVLYTDVNDAWLLPRRRDRLQIGAAGVAAELTLAAWATLAWGLLPDGPLRQGAFVLATTTWITSVLLNLSPFMRFDGYFLLMDATGLPNLHPRSFALARWWLREFLFGLGAPVPEPLAAPTRRLMIGFALLVWVYRLVVFAGIAVLVYHFFIKVVGIVLFVVEIGWFVALPVWREMRLWAQMRGRILAKRRGRVTLALAGLAAILAFVPLTTTVTAPAMLRSAVHRQVFPPLAARVVALRVADGQAVTAGQVLVELASPDLVYRRDQAQLRATTLERELAVATFDPQVQARSQSLRQDLSAALAEHLAAAREVARLTVTAPVDGTVRDLASDLAEGLWVPARQPLAAIVGTADAEIVAYVDEDAIGRIEAGADARFVAFAGDRAQVAARVVSVERTALGRLDSPALASTAGGPIVVRPDSHTLVPDRALYRVRLRAAVPVPLQALAGRVDIDAAGTSVAGRVWRAAAGVVMREAGL